MTYTPSLTRRIAIGKGVGLAVGLIGFFTLPLIYPEAPWQLRWGVMLWYVTFGAVIGMAGVYTRHPVLLLPMPWWVRAPLIGAWLNFVLVFFAHEEMSLVLAALFGPDGMMSSPFWFVADGVLIGYAATKFAGEGPETVDPV